MQLTDAKIIVFARAPEKGRVKTRLAKTVGDARALAIYCQLLDSVFQEMSGCDYHVCCYSDNPGHAYFDPWKNKDIDFHQQMGASLGERMFNSLQTEKPDKAPVILLGSDCPQLSCEIIHQVIDELSRGKQVVIVPATDGGYVLIAFADKVYRQLFDDISWSTDKVMQQTKARLNDLGLSFSLMEPLLDIDTIEDYQQFSGISQ